MTDMTNELIKHNRKQWRGAALGQFALATVFVLFTPYNLVAFIMLIAAIFAFERSLNSNAKACVIDYLQDK